MNLILTPRGQFFDLFPKSDSLAVWFSLRFHSAFQALVINFTPNRENFSFFCFMRNSTMLRLRCFLRTSGGCLMIEADWNLLREVQRWQIEWMIFILKFYLDLNWNLRFNEFSSHDMSKGVHTFHRNLHHSMNYIVCYIECLRNQHVM